MQIFPGGQAGINGGVSLPFPGRQGFASGLINGAAPKITVSGTLNRHRPSTSMVGLSGSSSSLLGVMSKPIRIAAGAAMKIDSGSASQSSQSAEPATGANTPPLTSWKPNPPSSNQGASLSRQGSFRDRDDGSVVSMNSAISASTIRSVKSTAATNSAAAAANKAEENRRLEEAARTRRKIADLEISNSSLMDINRTLEATIRKQASEVQELKMKIQAAQFGELGYSSADVVRAQSVEAIELNEEDMHDDQTFKRLCSSIEQMVKDAKLALDQSTRPAGIKVLSLYELYEKEIAEDVDEDDLHSDIDHSFADNGQDNDNSIEVITQDDGDSNHEQEGLRNTGISAKVVKRGNRTTLSTALGANMIASTILDTPLTMVT
ncbi:hypothetical protein BGX31_003936 [Mortierella sp. GBA43]|nr:hypothetical protein BGX31_003936 [Mortierella sp. GBA43]